MTIQMKAIDEPYFVAVMFIIPYKIVLPFESVNKNPKV